MNAGMERAFARCMMPTPPGQGFDPLDPPGAAARYAARIRRLVRLELDEPEARALWNELHRHRRELERRLGRDVGLRVALLDYVVNVRPRLAEPQIIERSALETIEYRAVADALTGLHNRWYFDAALVREIERCRRYDARSSLLLLDLDRFKAINDSYGHTVGDAVLRTVGTVIRRHLRSADVPCRLGGDEFAVLLSDTPVADAIAVAERIRSDAEASCHREISRELRLTFSAGVVAIGTDAAEPDLLVDAADAALYQAKRSGGNRVEGGLLVLEPAPDPGLG